MGEGVNMPGKKQLVQEHSRKKTLVPRVGNFVTCAGTREEHCSGQSQEKQ